MKLLQIVPRDGTHLYNAMMRKQAEIRRVGRVTFSGRERTAAKWVHVRHRIHPTGAGSIARGEGHHPILRSRVEARLVSSFLGWPDRHFRKHLSSVEIEYQESGRGK